MLQSRRGLFFLFGWFALLLAGTPFLPLFETTEARYAEIAREMLASGNWLEPQLNGILHFHKPPLAYWMAAAGMKLFGINEFGARFFGVAAAAGTLCFVYRTAMILLRERRQAETAALMFAGSILVIAVARMVSTDIYLTFCTSGALWFLFRQMRETRGRVNVVCCGLLLGLGFLAKGPVIFLFTLLPYLIAKIFDVEHRKVFSRADIALGSLIFVLVALPWYAAIIVRHPQLLNYFLKVQTVDRFATDTFRRNKPFWFFFAIFGGTFLPWIFFYVRSIAGSLRDKIGDQVLHLYVMVPFIVFSIGKSKLATYILPLYGIAAILAARELYRGDNDRLRRTCGTIMLLLAAAEAGAGFAYPPLAGVRWGLLATGVFSAVLASIMFRRVSAEAWTAAAAGIVFVSAGAITFAASAVQPLPGSFSTMVSEMNRIDPSRDLQTIVYGGYLPSISFYRGRLAIMAKGKERESEFETDEEYRKWYVTRDEELDEVIRQKGRFFLIINPSRLNGFLAKHPGACREIFRQKKQAAYLCDAAAPAQAGGGSGSNVRP